MAAKKRTPTKRGARAGAKRAAASGARPRGAASKSGAKRPAASRSAKKSTRKSTRARPSSSAATGGANRKLERYRTKRDFTRTAEPSGAERGSAAAARRSALRFVIQKHAASHLHYDFRLELDGVMKSWAVPKGPSVVPGVRRLAMEVEDHPISYNTFEGTIPAGEYGGGTVMLWDRGTYEETNGGGAAALREGYERGKLDLTLHGERLRGNFALVRTTGHGERAQWLLIKRTDAHARRDRETTDAETTSVVTGRSMDEIAKGRRVWRSNR